MRIPDDGANWICSLDCSIHCPFYDAVAVTPDGGPFLRPEKVLLFKGLQTRPKDQADFETAAPFLSMESRRWLAAALAHAKGDDHPWIPALT